MPLCFRFLTLVAFAFSLAVPPSQAQCSDCVTPGDHGALVLNADVFSSSSQKDRVRAQAGDATAVLADEVSGTTTGDSWVLHPSPTINTPTAFGAEWGQIYGGVSYQNRIRYSDWHDGIASLGAGFGNAQRTVALSATAAILDTYTDVADDWSLSLKLHRRLPWRSAIAVGYENIWHTDGTDGGESVYGVVSSVLVTRTDPASALGSTVVTLGMGTGRFRSEADFARGRGGLNPFGSVALRVLSRANGIANWSGQDLNLALSITPVRALPLVLTPALLDVTGRAGDGTRFAASATVALQLGK